MYTVFMAITRRRWSIRTATWLVICVLGWQWTLPLSAGALSIPEEIQIGRKILKNARKSSIIVNDYLVNRVVREIGQRLVRQAGETPFDFQFIVIKSDALNAFNVPGGLVFLSSGLLAFIEDENELAGVMAHEISHGISRHVSKMISKQKKLGLAAFMAMIIGAVLARSAKGAQASASLPMAAAQSFALKYSREYEEEADAGGLRMMAGAGFSPRAMVQLMNKFRQESTILPDVPSYLLTHPLEDVRMARMEGLLDGMQVSTASPFSGKEYGKIRARMMVTNKGTEEAIRVFQSTLDKDPRRTDDLFGLGIALREKGDFYAAANALYKASKLNYGSAEILKELGRCYFEWGRFQEAVRTLQVALQFDNEDIDALYYLGRAHEEMDNNSEALIMFRRLEERNPHYNTLYYHMGRVYDRMGKRCMSHYCLGQHFRLMGNSKMEHFHFNQVDNLQKQGNCAADDKPPARPKKDNQDG
ncbi:MAG: M48 family metalloprotease [Deltaproteobacteria bacterium]|nr:M48 family metalloprotease [Deltaproteobacteria bacterium]